MQENLFNHFVKKLCPYILLLFFFAACEEETIPSYLNIPSMSVAASGLEGSSSSNISDVWVYQNFNLQGAYEMPAEFPILAEGDTRLIVYGGITLNGISTTRAIYPFYDPDTIDVTLVPEQVVTVTPVVRYSSNAEFAFTEGFENANNFDQIERITGSDVFEGTFSGKLIIDTTDVIAISNAEYEIPFSSTAVFLEMDYKNTHVLGVGIIGIYSGEVIDAPKLNLTSKDEWSKVYINFTPEVNSLQADTYRIYFRVRSSADPNSIRIFFDNLKLIHAGV